MFIENNSFEQAKSYLNRLQLLNEQEGNLGISLYYRLAKGALLKKSPRITDKSKAQEIFQLIADEKEVPIWQKFYAMLNLCELLIDELKIYGEEEVLKQVRSLLNRINDLALEQHVTPVIVQSLTLQAKFSLVEGNAQQADQLLERAKLTAAESGFELLGAKVSEEQKQLHRELDKWNAINQSSAPLKERLELARMTDYITEALKFLPKN